MIKNGKFIPEQGGFSDEVWTQSYLQRYIETGHAFGWVGGTRKDSQDALLEKEFRRQGMGPRAISIWITSVAGRHLNDNPTYKNIKDASIDAPKQIVVWEHPDHLGSLGSTHELLQRLTEQEFKMYLHFIG